MAAIRERKDQNGKVSYQAQVRIQGYPPQSKTFLRKTDAKQWCCRRPKTDSLKGLVPIQN
ncbi:hypothetical protein [Acidovorax sp. NO-1]|uniref:hypothetical protein n=1 Tax=Acidovorax sp. NO-1 TaxID=512030 RepID=UPI000A2F8B03|nr:hypothetical protein [Acidovorax sp. NO-1]